MDLDGFGMPWAFVHSFFSYKCLRSGTRKQCSGNGKRYFVTLDSRNKANRPRT